MHTISQWLNKILEFVVAALVAITVLVVLWGVFSRFVVNVPSRWTEELATNLLTWIALLGAAIAFRQHQHLGVDYLYNKLHPAARRVNLLIALALIVVFAASVMVWGGSQLVAQTLASGQVTAAMGIRTGYTYLAVPLSGLAIVWFTLEKFLEIWRTPVVETKDHHSV